MTSRERLDQIIGSVYEAALSPDDWRDVVGAITKIVGATKAHLFGPNLLEKDVDFSVPVGIDPTVYRPYGDYYVTRDVWGRSAASLPPGSVATGPMLVPVEEFERSEFCQDFLRPLGIYHMLAALVFQQGDGPAHLAFYRPRTDDDFNAAESRVLQEIAPHVRRALRVQREIGALKLNRDADAGIVRLNRSGRLRSA